MEDILKYGLKIVFVGTAIGNESFKKNAYYANRANKFWDMIQELFIKGISDDPRIFKFNEQKKLLLENKFGLTDIIKNTSGSDKFVLKKDLSKEIKLVKEKIFKYKPNIIAFNGKQAAKLFYNRKIDYGRCEYDNKLNVLPFVLPSTSGVARRWWKKYYWKKLAREITRR